MPRYSAPPRCAGPHRNSAGSPLKSMASLAVIFRLTKHLACLDLGNVAPAHLSPRPPAYPAMARYL